MKPEPAAAGCASMGDYEDRKDYAKGALDQAPEHPEQWLQGWLDAAREADPEDYNAMTLSSIGADGHPDARIVLLRDLTWIDGIPALSFYTNYRSEKGQQVEAHPHAAATFFWPALERQLRVRGRVVRLSEAESDRYFASRPRASRIGAWASQQSEAVAHRAALEEARSEVESRFPGEVPRPPHWGGYRIEAAEIEFWQGRPGRLHDRFRFTRVGGNWSARRLQP